MAGCWRGIIGEDVRLEFNLAADLGQVAADPGQIEQVAEPGGQRARCHARGRRADDRTANVILAEPLRPRTLVGAPRRYVLSVSDTGVGMAAGGARRTSLSPSIPPKRWARAPAWAWPRSMASSSSLAAR